MAVTLLGKDALLSLMRGNGRVTIANRASSGTSLRILSAAIVRHDSGGDITQQAILELDLSPDEAQAFDLPEASNGNFTALEVSFRVFTPDQRGLREVYLSSPPDAAPARQWEVGVRPDTTPAETGEFFVPESPGLVAYIRASV
jgi:hypothetical protein